MLLTFIHNMIKPSPSAVFNAIKSLKPHVPLIKFRTKEGGSAGHSSHASSNVVASASAPPPPPQPSIQRSSPSQKVPSVNSVSFPVIEDWQLPGKYRKRPLSKEEIEYINRGGPE